MLGEKLNTMKMEPLLSEISSSNVSDKLTQSRRNSDRYQNHDRNLQIENNLLILKKASGINSSSLNQQDTNNEQAICNEARKLAEKKRVVGMDLVEYSYFNSSVELPFRI